MIGLSKIWSIGTGRDVKEKLSLLWRWSLQGIVWKYVDFYQEICLKKLEKLAIVNFNGQF